MEAVMLIEQIGSHGHLVQRQRFAGAGTECRVGRDLGCDIVLDDDHAAPQHALLTLQEDGRVSVRDLGTRNGTRVDGKRVPVDKVAIVEQGEIIVGRTRLRVRTRHTPLAAERLFRREFVRRHRTPVAALEAPDVVARFVRASMEGWWRRTRVKSGGALQRTGISFAARQPGYGSSRRSKMSLALMSVCALTMQTVCLIALQTRS